MTSLAVTGPNWFQVAGSGTPADCTSSFTLVPSAECNLSISFKPTEQGLLTGATALVDNLLNAPGSAQSSVLSGIGITPPHISSLNTTYAAPYSVVVLTGTSFGATQGTSTVTFNGVVAPVSSWSNTLVEATVPPTATTGNIVLTAYGTASNAVAFTVLPMPVVTGISPTSGTAGTVVTIGGNNLLDYQNHGTVTFDGKSLPIISQSSTAIKVAAPPGTGAGVFHVLVNDTGINTPTFTYEEAIAGTGAVDFGSANVCSAGKTTPAPCSQSVAVTFNVLVNGALGTPLALTTGAPNLDFKLASGSTCTGAVTAGNTCTVNVTFAPIAPGVRKGAIEITDTSGDVLATTYVDGTGVGPLIGFLPGQPRNLGTSAGDQYLIQSSIATDASGDVFVVDDNQNHPLLKELVAVDGVIPDKPVIKVLTGSGYFPTGLAVDGAGNVFFTDNVTEYASSNYQSAVREVLAADGYKTIKTFGITFIYPYGIAVDGSGNVFVGDQGSYIDPTVAPNVSEVFAASGYTTSKKLGGDFVFGSPWALTLDNSGNLFVADSNCCSSGYGAVLELPASGGYSTVRTIDLSGPIGSFPYGVAIDPAGNLFVLFLANPNGLEEFLAVDGVLPATPATALVYIYMGFSPNAMAIDGRGNLYFSTDNQAALVEELPFSAPSLAFADTSVGHISSDSPQSIQIQNQGNANLDVTSFSLNSPNWYEVPGSGTPKDCAASFSLIPGTGCNVSIAFKPTQADSLTGALTVVDNSLNAAAGTQSVSLSGEGITFPPPQIAGLSTTYGAPYSVVAVTGTNFGAAEGSSTVTFSGVSAPISSWSNTGIVLRVPPTAVTGNVVVTVGGEASNTTPFTLVSAPRITGISPTGGLVGTIVTITGENLLDLHNQGTVSFNGGNSLPVISQTGTQIQVAVPAGAVTGPFHVYANDTGINTPTFTVVP